jgi:hypothetical protein
MEINPPRSEAAIAITTKAISVLLRPASVVSASVVSASFAAPRSGVVDRATIASNMDERLSADTKSLSRVVANKMERISLRESFPFYQLPNHRNGQR